jgi:D-glycero-D-manno-heptose 1,7-bisphosphate phosphatase
VKRLAAVLFDRDGTLVEDVPYNADPDRVAPIEGAVDVVEALRSRHLRIGVVTNQSGVARGMIRSCDVERVNDRVDRLFGGFDAWCVCPHGPDDACTCRKPAPGLVIDGAARLGVATAQVMVVGDRLADVEAAGAAGALSVLVPSVRTEPAAREQADHVLGDIGDLVGLVDAVGRSGP